MKAPKPYAELKEFALLKRKLFCEAKNRSLEYYAIESEYIPIWETMQTILGKIRIRSPYELKDLIHQKHLN